MHLQARTSYIANTSGKISEQSSRTNLACTNARNHTQDSDVNANDHRAQALTLILLSSNPFHHLIFHTRLASSKNLKRTIFTGIPRPSLLLIRSARGSIKSPGGFLRPASTYAPGSFPGWRRVVTLVVQVRCFPELSC